jgi:uracil-DNA glycosylase
MNRWPVVDDAPAWAEVLEPFLLSSHARRLRERLQERLDAGAPIYPPDPLRALRMCEPHRVRVVIVGQDPYHQRGQANGLAFSVASGVPMPPSLRNILSEVIRTQGHTLIAGGDLTPWAEQGVLLLNTCLTVEDSSPGAHAGWGWEVLTSNIFRHVAQQPGPVVFMLWGAHAQRGVEDLDLSRHLVLCSNHPSPLAARRPPVPFVGNGHFERANAWLVSRGQAPIEW